MLRSFELTDYSSNSIAYLDPEEVIKLDNFVFTEIPEKDKDSIAKCKHF